MAYGALDIAKTALFAQQIGLQVTSHNIANVNNPDYSRQEVVFAPYPPIPYPFGTVGRGVRVEGIRRLYDHFLTVQLRRQHSTRAYWEARRGVLAELDAVFNELDEQGLGRVLDHFWQAWQDLANNPWGYAERAALLGTAKALSENLNYKARQLLEISEDLEGQMALVAEEVNRMAAQIARLNLQIVEAETRGQGANDLRDERDRLIQELSQRVNLTAFEDEHGKVSVLIGGSPLVEGTEVHWQMEVREDAALGQMKVELVSSSGTRVDITQRLTGGKLGGLLSMRNGDLVQLQTQLDAFARALIFAVNRLHSQGEGLQRQGLVTGTYRVEDPRVPLDNAGLAFDIQAGTFWVRVFDASGTLVAEAEISVDPSTQSLEDVASSINSAFPSGEVTARVEDGRLVLEAASGNELSFASEGGTKADSSGLLAALGINTFFTGQRALDMALNPALEADPNLIAAASYASTSGDNTVALAISELRGQALLEGATPGDYYASMVGRMAVAAQDAEERLEFEEAMLQSLENRRSEVSGVNLDEEMVNLMKFQRAYEAAARVIAAVDEMLQAIIAMR